MMNPVTPAFTLWLRAASSEIDLSRTVHEIETALASNGIAVETIDAAGLAREAYRRGLSGQEVAIAIGMTCSALNKHGIAAIVFGARTSANEFEWKQRKPERVLDIVCAHEGDQVIGKGPRVVLHPLDAKVPDSEIDDPEPGSDTGIQGPRDEESIESGFSQESGRATRFSIEPLITSISKAGWFGTERSEDDSDDELMRERLRQLGYL